MLAATFKKSDKKMKKAIIRLLPENCRLSQEEIDSYWTSFADELEIAYSKLNFKKIEELVYFVIENPIERKPKGKALEKVLVILYKIATRIPVYSISNQIDIFILIPSLLGRFINGKPLIDWHLAYNFLTEFYTKDVFLYLIDNGGYKLSFPIIAIGHLSYFFSESAGDEIMDLMVPKISPRGINFENNLIIFSALYPANSKNYKRAVDFIIDVLSSVSTTNILFVLWKSLSSFVYEFPNDDHSKLIDPLLSMIVTFLFYDSRVTYLTNAIQSASFSGLCNSDDFNQVLATALARLFFAPKTRARVIKEFVIITENAKHLTHPSHSQNYSPKAMLLFISTLANKVQEYDAYSRKGKRNFPRENIPSAEEYEKFLSPIVTVLISLTEIDNVISKIVDTTQSLLCVCPSLIDRFFNYISQVLSMNDAVTITGNAWIIMSCIVLFIDHKPDFFDIMKNYVRLAIDTFYNIELQKRLSLFLGSFFSVCPLTEETNFPKELNPTDLIVDIFNILLEFVKHVSEDVKQAQICFTHRENIFTVSYTIFSGASKTVLHALLPTLIAMISDSSLFSSSFDVAQIMAVYSMFAPKEDLRAIYDEAMKQTKRTLCDLNEIRFILGIIATTGRGMSECEEDSRKVIKDLEKFREHEKRKVRAVGWSSTIAVLCSLYSNVIVADYDPKVKDRQLSINPELFRESLRIKPPNTVLIDDMKLRILENDKYYPKLAEEVIYPFMEKVKQVNDPAEAYDLLKPFYISFMVIFTLKTVMKTDDVSQYPLFMQKCRILKRSNRYSSELFEKTIEFCEFLHNKFRNNSLIEMIVTQILGSTVRMSNTLLNPVGLTSDLGIKEERAHQVRNRFFVQFLATNVYKDIISKALYPMPSSIDKIIKIIFDQAFSGVETISCTASKVIELLQTIYPSYTNRKIYEVLTDKNQKLTSQFIEFYFYVCPNHCDDCILPLIIRFLKEPIDFSKPDTESFLRGKISLFLMNNFIITTESEALWTDFLLQISEILDHSTELSSVNEFIVICVLVASIRRVKDVPESIWRYIISTTYNPNIVYSLLSAALISTIIERRIHVDGQTLPITNKTPSYKYPSYERMEIDGNLPIDYFKASAPSPLIKDVDAYDSESQGFYAYSNEYVAKKREGFVVDKYLIESVPNFLQFIINMPKESTESFLEHFETKYFSKLCKYVGPTITPVIASLLEQLNQENISTDHWLCVDDILGCMANAITCWPEEDANEFVRTVIVKHMIDCINNPALVGNFERLVSSMALNLHASRISPLINYLFSAATIDPDAPVWRRSAMVIFSTLVNWAPLSFQSSHEIIINNFIQPMLDDIEKYSTTSIEDIINLIFSTYTCWTISKESPQYDPKSEEHIENMNQRLIKAIKIANPKSKKAQFFVALFVDCLPSSHPNSLHAIFPVLIETVPKILKFLTLSDKNNADKLISAFHDTTTHPGFATNNESVIKFLDNAYQCIDIMSIELQKRFINSTRAFIRYSTFATSLESLESFMVNMRKVVEKATDPLIRCGLIATYGVLLRRVGKKPEDIYDQCAILQTAYLIDQRDEMAEKAFAEIEKAMQTCNRADREMFLMIVSGFWSEHADQIASNVSEALDRYRTLAPPSYII